MKVLICGLDGYIGWPLALRLAKAGHEVCGLDNFSRRRNVEELGSWSAIPILDMKDRIAAAKEAFGIELEFYEADMRDYSALKKILERCKPNAIVHLAEQPSAPFSMMDRNRAVFTQENNVIGTLNLLFAMKEATPKGHLVKLGTMGEYGTPNIDIPEGFFEVEFRGRKDRLPFPRQAGSFYHWSKVHDSGNIMFACKIWGLRSTDIMQGVVYGTRTPEILDERLHTRFDFDECFGTVINRFCAQAVIGHPLTVYGKGGQRRGFIALEDSIQCLELALEKPPEEGNYRVLNQLDEIYSVYELAEAVKEVSASLGMEVEIGSVANPRIESEEHYYKVDTQALRALGFRPTRSLKEQLRIMIRDLSRYKERIMAKKSVIIPRTSWIEGRRG